MRVACVIGSICAVLTLSGPAWADALTLQRYLSQVHNANPAIQSAQFRSKGFDNRVDPAGALDDPFIAAGVDEVPFGYGSGYVRRYQISQAFPFPGKRSTK